MPLVADLQSRGLIHQVSDPDVDAKLAQLQARSAISAYAGFDPTGDSLHVGNFAGNGVRGLWLLLGLAPPLLFVTGFTMWWTRVVRPRWRASRGAP